MAYTIYKSDGTPISVPDGTIDQTYSVNLVGNNASSFGEPIAESTIRLTENFSNSTPPLGAVKGQLWFNTGTNSLRVWTGTDPGLGDNSETDIEKWLQVGGQVEASILPDEPGIDIGSATQRFGTGYFERLNVDNGPAVFTGPLDGSTDAITMTGFMGVNGTIYPLDPTADDITDTLGTAAARWDVIYADTVDVSNRVLFSTFAGFQAGTTTNAIIPTTASVDLGASIASQRFGTIYASTVDATVTNADETNKLSQPRNIALTGDVTGDADFDGSNDIFIDASVAQGPGSGLDADTLDGNHASAYYTKTDIDAIIAQTIAASQNASWPVGSIYENRTDNRNPADILGFGTWTTVAPGRVTVEYSSGETEFNAIGETGGDKTVALTTAQMASHVHTGPSHRHTGPSHTHSTPNHSHSASFSGTALPAHTHSFGVGGTDTFNGATNGSSNAGQRTTSAVSAGTPSGSVTVNSGGASTTGSAGTGNTGYAGTNNTGSAGSGSAHNNLQPYIVVYRWYRTA